MEKHSGLFAKYDKRTQHHESCNLSGGVCIMIYGWKILKRCLKVKIRRIIDGVLEVVRLLLFVNVCSTQGFLWGCHCLLKSCHSLPNSNGTADEPSSHYHLANLNNSFRRETSEDNFQSFLISRCPLLSKIGDTMWQNATVLTASDLWYFCQLSDGKPKDFWDSWDLARADANKHATVARDQGCSCELTMAFYTGHRI